jgi:hypothetical protein
MSPPTHEVQVRLGIEVEDDSLLLSHLPDEPDAAEDIKRAIVLALTTVFDSHALRDELSTYGLAVRRGEVRLFTQHVATVMPGSGLDHPVAQAADPLMT